MTTRILAWNIRAGGGKRIVGILDQIHAWQPTIIGLSEFRGTAASQWVATRLAEIGYPFQQTTTDQTAPTKNALLLAAKVPLCPIHLPHMPQNAERWLPVQVETVPALTVGLMHVPNYTTPTRKYPYLDALLQMAAGWQGGPAIILGDANCGKHAIDEAKPSAPKFQREHDWMVGMEARGWIDAFRHIHGNRREYTWYSHRDNGFRLDHAFCSPTLADAIVDVQHAWGGLGADATKRTALSDHAALIIDLDLSVVAG